MTKEEFLKLTDKYNHGNCSHEEKYILEQFCKNVQIQKISEEWNLEEEEKIKLRLLKKISLAIDHSPVLPHRNYRKASIRWRWSIAASIALLIALGWGYFTIHNATTEIKYITKTTLRGQKTTVLLPDSTIIYLNAESSLVYPENFDHADKREVKFSGEAFFKVKRNTEKPFLVYSDQITTTVLGTSFNINAFPESDEILVTVASGKVNVASNLNSSNKQAINQAVQLTKLEQAIFQKSSSELKETKVSNRNFLAWKRDIILLDKVSMEESAAILSRWYDVEFVFDNEAIRNCTIQGKFKKDKLQNILQNLAFLTGLKFTVGPDQKVHISGQSCN